MSLPDIPSTVASIVYLAEYTRTLISRLRKKKIKPKTKSRKRKQTKDEELINDLLTNPELAIKKIGAEYVVKNRKKIIRGIVNSVIDE
ncbi:MAG: hypothetical protein HY223_06840 [Thaumarchaeota archaeon]|nr:hypothetical protein [Nitrososphaerota archaeon]